MGNDLSHDDYVLSVRRKVAALAQDMISGSVPFLEGAIQLSALHSEADVSDQDPDFRVFALIESETDHLPIGSVRKLWAPDALERHAAELEASSEWAQQIGLAACRSLVARYSA